jgi:hypothetical protein
MLTPLVPLIPKIFMLFDFPIFWPDESYSRNASCAQNYISTFLCRIQRKRDHLQLEFPELHHIETNNKQQVAVPTDNCCNINIHRSYIKKVGETLNRIYVLFKYPCKDNTLQTFNTSLVVHHPAYTFLHFDLLLKNHWAKLERKTWIWYFLWSPSMVSITLLVI